MVGFLINYEDDEGAEEKQKINNNNALDKIKQSLLEQSGWDLFGYIIGAAVVVVLLVAMVIGMFLGLVWVSMFSWNNSVALMSNNANTISFDIMLYFYLVLFIIVRVVKWMRT
tara:strand:+ start:6703 stop:7041 length:339 start_codon:yes stop_codon:yes gene_type:complete